MFLQGVAYAIGGSLLYAPCISYMSEWFVVRRGLANGVIFAGKYIISSYNTFVNNFVSRNRSRWFGLAPRVVAYVQAHRLAMDTESLVLGNIGPCCTHITVCQRPFARVPCQRASAQKHECLVVAGQYLLDSHYREHSSGIRILYPNHLAPNICVCIGVARLQILSDTCITER